MHDRTSTVLGKRRRRRRFAEARSAAEGCYPLLVAALLLKISNPTAHAQAAFDVQVIEPATTHLDTAVVFGGRILMRF